jgi:processive 1,2-diacylglycerol beta-glucosyltransferase
MVAVDTLSPPVVSESATPRIAILHATAGSGHKRAAQAIAEAVSTLHPESVVREVDTLVFASRLYRDTYASSYNAMQARAPRLWGVLYRSWELVPVNRGTAPVRLAIDRLNLRRLVRVCEREQPDALVCTHFLPVEALSYVRGRGRLLVPLYCVITDFAAHPFWAFPNVDRYFVATDGVAAELTAHGVPRDRIQVSGIPVDPKFATTIGRDAARDRLRLHRERPAVLIMGGGSGVGPLAEVADRIAALPSAPSVVVVCGTNLRLRERVALGEGARTGRVRVFGFTNEVDVLLEACDVVVSKAGGLTCSEALVKRTPLVVFRPMPGQEVRNTEHLEREGAAIHADTIDDVASAVARLLVDHAAADRMRAAADRLAAPRAAETIARRVLEDISVRRA